VSFACSNSLFEYRATSSEHSPLYRRHAPETSITVAKRVLSESEFESRLKATRVLPHADEAIKFHTVFDMIDFKGPSDRAVLVAKQSLVSYRNLHRIICAKDSRQARELLSRYPRATAAILPDGSTIRKKGSVFMGDAASQGSRIAQVRFNVSREDQIKHLEEHIRSLRASSAAAQDEKESLDARKDAETDALKKMRTKVGAIDRKLKTAQSGVSKSEKALQALREREKESGDAAVSKRLEDLEEEVDDHVHRAEQTNGRIAELMRELEAVKAEIKPLREQIEHEHSMAGDGKELAEYKEQKAHLEQRADKIERKIRKA